jgi:single-strand DNA-binding protein
MANHNFRRTNKMNINRDTIAGFAGRGARNNSTQNGKHMTRLSIAVIKRYKGAEASWQEKAQWHTCVVYGSAAEYAARVQTGAHVFIEGEIVCREYERTIDTETGPVKVPWPVNRRGKGAV